MKNLSKDVFIERVREVHDGGYEPNDVVKKSLEDISLVAIAGPSGVGKDTLRRRLAAFHRVVSDTTREPRENNGASERDGEDYHFRGRELGQVWDDVREGRYVQFGMGPGHKSFYGSRREMYPASGPALVDVVASQLEVVRELPFNAVHSIYVVAQSFERWQQRLDGRGEMEPDERAARHTEAKTGLELALADDQTTFIINQDAAWARRDIYKLVYDGDLDIARQQEGRELGQLMLNGLIEQEVAGLVPTSKYYAVD